MATKADSLDVGPGEDSGIGEESGKPRLLLRQRIVRLVCRTGVLALVLYGLSNLWLWSGWGTGVAEDQLRKRTGQDWEIGGMSWSPWNGVSIYDARMLQPDELRENLSKPVVSVKKISVRPYWAELARGRVKLRSVEIHSPEIAISLEMMAAMASQAEKTEKKVAVAAVGGQPAARESSTSGGGGESTAKPPERDASPPAKPVKLGERKRPPAGLPLRLKITDASLKILSVTKGVDVLSVDGLSYDHVLLGEDSEGMFSIRGLDVLGVGEVSGVRQKVIWKRPYLTCKEQSVDLGGVDAGFAVQLGVVKNRIGHLPFLLDFTIDRQRVKSVSWLEHVAMQARAGSVHARFRVNGYLHNPQTWRADGMLTAQQIAVREKHGNHDVVFDEVYVPCVLRQGVLLWDGVRFISDDLSLLGNGSVSMRDGHLSVTRIVASPEAAAILIRGIRGANLIGGRSRWWYKLDTSDRVMRDLVVSGSLLEPEIDAGEHYASIPLMKMLTILYDFVRMEMREAERDLQVLSASGDHNPQKSLKR